MSEVQLLAHFNRIADARDASTRLRRFVFDLAIRGRLVPQSNDDEPASELLKRISVERARLSKSNKSSVKQFIGPFVLPQSWAWTRLGDVAQYGSSEKVSSNKDIPDDTWVLDLEDIEKDSSKLIERVLSRERPFQSAKTVFSRGDVLFGKLRPYLNKSLVADSNGVCTTEIVPIRGYSGVLPEYLQVVLKSPLTMNRVNQLMYGMKMPRLGTEDAVTLYFPLPPLAEQRRILSRVDELLGLLDQIVVARIDREETRDRLVAATLAPIRDASSTTLQESVRFLLDGLDVFSERVDHVSQIRQIILSLAVRGALTRQIAKDEHASELLKKIAIAVKELQSAKKIRAQKPALPATNFEIPAIIPETWQHAYLQDLAYQITDGTHLTPKYADHGKPFLSAQNVKPFRFMPEKHRFVSEIDFQKYRANRRPERGDILLTRVGAGIGEAAVLDSDFEFAFYVSLCLIKIPTEVLSAEYLVIWLNSPQGRESSKVRTYGKDASQGNLNLGLIRTFKIPVPPLAEQYRIVAKVKELMKVCDLLELDLNRIETTRGLLLDSLIAEALSQGAEQYIHQPANTRAGE